MTQVRTHKTKWGREVRGTVTLTIRAEVKEDKEFISEQEAEDLLAAQLDEYSGSNDGSELLANADVVISENDRVHDSPAEGGIFPKL